MVRRCAMRRRVLQNSPDASASTTAVRSASAANSPPPMCRPRPLAVRQVSKKYRPLRLWRMSKSVPAATSAIIAATKACIIKGETVAESAANGLSVNIDPPCPAQATRAHSGRSQGAAQSLRLWRLQLGDDGESALQRQRHRRALGDLRHPRALLGAEIAFETNPSLDALAVAFAEIAHVDGRRF